jgi:hypothetical protein
MVSGRHYANPCPGSLLVLLHEPLEDENNYTIERWSVRRTRVPKNMLPIAAALCKHSCGSHTDRVRYGR